MIQLIQKSDIIIFKSISVNLVDAKKLDPFILEAQQFDLKKLMGDVFFLDFIKDFSASPILAKYGDLFNGCEFTYNGYTHRQEGIKTMLCYLSYSRYVLNSNIDSTATGTVNKITPESEHADDKTVLRLYNQAYSGALEYWEDIQRYLHVMQFPLWLAWHNHLHKKQSTIRIGGATPDDKNKLYYNYRNRRGEPPYYL